MFRIVVHSLWSKDKIGSLMKILCRMLYMDPDTVRGKLEKLDKRSPIVIYTTSLVEANEIGTDLVQYGAYISVEQVGAFSNASVAQDIIELMNEETGSWYALVKSKSLTAVKLIEERTLIKLRFSNTDICDIVAEEMLQRGSSPINHQQMALLEKKIEELNNPPSQNIEN